MKLHVRYRSLSPTPELHERIARRLHFALSRFALAIREVTVTLIDVNGPRGGIDKVCRVRIDGLRGAPVVVEATAAAVPAAIDGAMARAARSAARSLQRRWPAPAIN